MAGLYTSRGDYAKAEPIYKQSLEIRRTKLGAKHPDYAKSLHGLAELYRAAGDYAKAEPLFREVLDIRRQALGESHVDYAQTLLNLAHLHAAAKEPSKGVTAARQALRIARGTLERTAAVQSERQQLAMTAKLRSYLDGFLTVTAEAAAPGEEVYTEILAWKGLVSGRQQTIRKAVRVPDVAKPEVAKLALELTQASRKLATLSLASYDPDKQAGRLAEVARLSDEVERLERELAGASEEFRIARAQQHRTVADIRKVLPAGTVLLDLLEYEHSLAPATNSKTPRERRLAAFVIRSDRPTERIDLGRVESIAASVDLWRQRFGGPVDGVDPAAVMRRLFWEPLRNRVNDAKVLLVCPDGPISRFPLTALPGDAPGTYLIEERAIAIVPVPQTLPEMLQPATGGGGEPSLLLVGDVAFDTNPGEPDTGAVATRSAPRAGTADSPLKWQSLPGTRAEVVAIKDSFARRFRKAPLTELREEEATEEEVRRQAPRHRYLHFATHGFFAPPQLRSALATGKADSGCGCSLFGKGDLAGFHPGLLSGLVLAGANKPVAAGRDDGILTALEVTALDLGGVELAALSACETGLGENAGGEGLLGLQRAFQVAGARSVVASLWQVRDDAARALMVDFYENLWRKKMPKLEALRQAQLAMLREGIKRGITDVRVPKERLPKDDGRLPPQFWAAFVLSGDWR